MPSHWAVRKAPLKEGPAVVICNVRDRGDDDNEDGDDNIPAGRALQGNCLIRKLL